MVATIGLYHFGQLAFEFIPGEKVDFDCKVVSSVVVVFCYDAGASCSAVALQT